MTTGLNHVNHIQFIKWSFWSIHYSMLFDALCSDLNCLWPHRTPHLQPPFPQSWWRDARGCPRPSEWLDPVWSHLEWLCHTAWHIRQVSDDWTCSCCVFVNLGNPHCLETETVVLWRHGQGRVALTENLTRKITLFTWEIYKCVGGFGLFSNVVHLLWMTKGWHDSAADTVSASEFQGSQFDSELGLLGVYCL